MKTIFLSLFLVLVVLSCKKEDALFYAGDYDGRLSEEDYTAQGGNIIHTDTSYAYTVSVLETPNHYISIRGFNNANNIAVDGEGFFTFKDYGRTFDGQFRNDSLYLGSVSSSGSGTSYHHSIINFEGERR